MRCITTDTEVLQEMIAALGTLQLDYIISALHLPIKTVRDLFKERDVHYDGVLLKSNTEFNNLGIDENTVVGVWIINIKWNGELLLNQLYRIKTRK